MLKIVTKKNNVIQFVNCRFFRDKKVFLSVYSHEFKLNPKATNFVVDNEKKINTLYL